MSILSSMIVGALTSSVVYPATPSEQNKIPLWLKMYAYPFTTNSIMRSANYMIGGPMLRSVIVPAPKTFTSKTLIRYDDSVDDAHSNLTKADPTDNFDWIPGVSIGRSIIGAVSKVDDYVSEQLGFGASVNMDMYDATYQSSSKRAFSTKLIMPAWNVEDALAAAKVSDTLEAFALPAARIDSALNKAIEHPPMWQVGIGAAGAVKCNRQWSGQPQICVLTQVITSKMGFNDAYGIADRSGEIKPMCIVVDISFIEIEPAMRGSLGTDSIINRSTAFSTAGVGGDIQQSMSGN